MSWYPYRWGASYAPSTGKPTLAWAQAVKRLELAGLAPGEPEADRILRDERLQASRWIAPDLPV